MSESVEFWRDLKEYNQERALERESENIATIKRLSSQLSFSITEKQNSLRLHGVGFPNEVVYDIFPKSGKWHNLKNNKRGIFQDCEKFLLSCGFNKGFKS